MCVTERERERETERDRAFCQNNLQCEAMEFCYTILSQCVIAFKLILSRLSIYFFFACISNLSSTSSPPFWRIWRWILATVRPTASNGRDRTLVFDPHTPPPHTNKHKNMVVAEILPVCEMNMWLPWHQPHLQSDLEAYGCMSV